MIETNLTSAFLCSQAVYPAMKAAGGGKIINIGSMMSIFGASFAPAYAASKGGIVQFTRSCACAWAADNIQANAVLPGWIDTDLTKRAREQIDGLHDRVLARTPAARWGEIADFAGIAVFSPRRRRISSPAPRFPSMAAFRSWDSAASARLRELADAAGECTCSGRTPSATKRAVMPCSHGTALTSAHRTAEPCSG